MIGTKDRSRKWEMGNYLVMPATPCPYFSLSTGTISVTGHYHPLRVPICRCALTEPLTARLRTHPDGEQLASFLEGPLLDGQPHPVVAADLQPVSAATCTNERKQVSCVPHFLDLLNDFGLDRTIPAEEPPYVPDSN